MPTGFLKKPKLASSAVLSSRETKAETDIISAAEVLGNQQHG